MVSLTEVAPAELAVDDEIVLQRVSLDDAAELYDMVQADHVHLSEWLNFAKRLTPQKAATLCQDADTQATCWSGIDYWIIADDTKLGYANLRRDHGMAREWDMAYWLRANATGRGLATRTVKRLSRLAFEDMDASAVYLRINSDNTASQKVAANCGAVILPVLNFGYFDTWSLPYPAEEGSL